MLALRDFPSEGRSESVRRWPSRARVETRDVGAPVQPPPVRRREPRALHLGGRGDEPVGRVATEFGERNGADADPAVHRFTDLECSGYPEAEPVFPLAWVNYGLRPSDWNREPWGERIDIGTA